MNDFCASRLLLASVLILSSAGCLPSQPQSGFAACARAADPTACLVTRAASASGIAPEELTEAVVTTGAVEIITHNAPMLVAGAKSEMSSADDFLGALGLHADASEQTDSSSDRVILAAVSLAAAAQRNDNPFNDPVVRSLSASAGDNDTIPEVALNLWYNVDVYSEWSSRLTRPRGLRSIWDAIVARPPTDNRVLLELATWAAFSETFSDDGLALLRVLMTRHDATADAKAEAASLLARRYFLADQAQALLRAGGQSAPNYDVHGIEVEIAEARLRHGYDEAAAQLIVADRLHDLRGLAYQSYLNPSPLDALEQARAQIELRRLGESYLQRARRRSGGAEDTGEWYALASDCFRRAGDDPAAVSAAREGMPYVAPAVTARGGDSPDPRRAVIEANGFGAEPALALYKAGARTEAIGSGYVSGFDRYQADSRSGAPIDFEAIIADRSWFYAVIIGREMISGAQPALSEKFYRALSGARSQFADVPPGEYQRQLGLMAALTGRRAEMQSDFAEAAALLDRDRNSDVNAASAFALALAADWRRGEVIISRQEVRRARSVN